MRLRLRLLGLALGGKGATGNGRYEGKRREWKEGEEHGREGKRREEKEMDGKRTEGRGRKGWEGRW